jgi:hypothetical protein
MAKKGKKAPAATNPALARRYSSIAEIKREFFPNAAAQDEAAASARMNDYAYENLMGELFGQHQTQA